MFRPAVVSVGVSGLSIVPMHYYFSPCCFGAILAIAPEYHFFFTAFHSHLFSSSFVLKLIS